MLKNSKKFTLILSLFTLFTIVVGVTLAFVTSTSGPITNTFTTATVNCSVALDGSTYVVTNNGDTSAYVRVSVEGNFVSDTGDIYYTNPTTSVSLSNSEDWELKADGFYYSKSPIEAGASLNFATVSTSGTVAGYTATFQISVDAIQGTASALSDAWGIQ